MARIFISSRRRDLLTGFVKGIEFINDSSIVVVEHSDYSLTLEDVDSDERVRYRLTTQGLEEMEEMEDEALLMCSLCHAMSPAKTAHLHQGGYIGECCWDDRLKSSE